MLRAGVATAVISPPIGIWLCGYPNVERANKGVHDDLYASCLYIDNGKKKIAFVSLDLLNLGKQITAKIKKGFEGTDIFLCSTHTHSGPQTCKFNGEIPPANAEYIAFLTDKVIEAICEAKENTFAASIGIGKGRCGSEQGVGGNRREKDGPCDPSVNVIAVTDDVGVVRGIIVNYTLHPTFLHAENELVSADYPCYIRRYFHFAKPQATVLFMQGAAGDQSSRYHRVGQDYDEASRAGTLIAAEADRVIGGMEFSRYLDIEAMSAEIDLPFKQLPSREEALRLLKEAEEKFERTKGGPYIPMRNAQLNLFGAQSTLKYIDLLGKGYLREELPCEVSVIRLNDNLIACVQGEIFVEYGLKVKEFSPFRNTFFFELCNGALPGYVCTPESLREGGYETGASIFSQDAGNIILEKIKEMMTCLTSR